MTVGGATTWILSQIANIRMIYTPLAKMTDGQTFGDTYNHYKVQHSESVEQAEPLLRETHSLGVSAGAVLGAEASHTHSSSLDSGQVEEVKVGGAALWQGDYSLCVKGSWLRISSQQLLSVLKAVQSFQTHTGPCLLFICLSHWRLQVDTNCIY